MRISIIRILPIILIIAAFAAWCPGCGGNSSSDTYIPTGGGTGSGSGNVTGGGTGTGSGTGTGTGTGSGTGTGPLTSTDQWEQVYSGTTNDLYGISFASATVGWAVGLSQTMLYTDSGGDSWVDQFGNIDPNARPSHETSGHFLGSKTPNPGPAQLLDVHAVDTSTAWVSCYGPCNGFSMTPCFVTTDGGAKWTCVLTATNFQEWGIYAFDGENARICTLGSPSHSDSNVIVIENGYDEDSPLIPWASLYDISFGTRNDGWTAGIDIYHSTNGGTSWDRQTPPSGAGYFFGVTAVDADRAWICGQAGTIANTVDGGATWTMQESGVSKSLLGIDFIDANRGWCVGGGGTILATTDGGETWVPQDSGVSHDLASVSAVDATHVWACGAGGMILRSK
ncbi:MAG: hypothetical protein E3J72_02030 [Planctomycetota bacterium]|nr:MAG: hypothetical protein E3J72_02030 [Planctomycetota bacterium]